MTVSPTARRADQFEETRLRRVPFSNWLRRCYEALGRSEEAARIGFNEMDSDGSGELERMEIRSPLPPPPGTPHQHTRLGVLCELVC